MNLGNCCRPLTIFVFGRTFSDFGTVFHSGTEKKIIRGVTHKSDEHYVAHTTQTLSLLKDIQKVSCHNTTSYIENVLFYSVVLISYTLCQSKLCFSIDILHNFVIKMTRCHCACVGFIRSVCCLLGRFVAMWFYLFIHRPSLLCIGLGYFLIRSDILLVLERVALISRCFSVWILSLGK